MSDAAIKKAKTVLLPPMSEPLKPDYFAESFLYAFSSIDRKKKSQKRKILAYLLDAYAVANFNWEDTKNGQNRTLDEAGKLKFLADHISRDLLGFEFDHYSLEEMYRYPIQKDEKAADRVKALKDRAVEYSKCEINVKASLALKYARQIGLYVNNGKPKEFWYEVVVILEGESAKELGK